MLCSLLLLQNDQVLQGFSVDKGEFTCPLCRQFANSVLPCRPGRGSEVGAWHVPSTKPMHVLVKEVEDLQDQMAIFPVSSTVRQTHSRPRPPTPKAPTPVFCSSSSFKSPFPFSLNSFVSLRLH